MSETKTRKVTRSRSSGTRRATSVAPGAAAPPSRGHAVGSSAAAAGPHSKRSMKDYVIAIPSYKRAETLRDKTLALLKSFDVPVKKIHVFVATEDEKKVYEETLEKGTYGHLIVAIPGMAKVRNFITQHFPVGTPIVNIDDDIKGFIQYASGAKRHEKPLTDFDGFVKKAFREANDKGFRLWGIYPVANGFFMKEGSTDDLKYIIGAFWGIINPGIKTLKMTIDDKEDYLRSIVMYLADGGVLRYNNVAPQTAYYKEPGGMQEERTKDRVTKSAEALHKAYPDLTSLNATKKSGFLELRLKDKREEKVFGQKALDSYTQPNLLKD